MLNCEAFEFSWNTLDGVMVSFAQNVKQKVVVTQLYIVQSAANFTFMSSVGSVDRQTSFLWVFSWDLLTARQTTLPSSLVCCITQHIVEPDKQHKIFLLNAPQAVWSSIKRTNCHVPLLQLAVFPGLPTDSTVTDPILPETKELHAEYH